MQIDMSSRAKIAPNMADAGSWQSVLRPSAHRAFVLLSLVGGVWTFEDPDRDRLYRLVIDKDGKESWSFQEIRKERASLSQSEAARLIGVTRQAIRNAITHGRLTTIDSNGRSLVRRSDVLALKIVRRQYKHSPKR